MGTLYMLDTDMASYVIRGTDSVVMENFSKYFSKLCISSITAAELQFGAVKKNSKPLTEKVDAFCELLPVKSWNLEAAVWYGKLRAELEKEGTPLAAMDLLIAASALTEGAVLVTNNEAHFSKVKHLSIENWLA